MTMETRDKANCGSWVTWTVDRDQQREARKRRRTDTASVQDGDGER